MTFGEALNACKDGAHISRKGWNGRDQYIEIASDIEYTNFAGERKKASHLDVGSHCLVFVNPSRGFRWVGSHLSRICWRMIGWC